MTLVYIFLALVVAYCLFQSIRFRVMTWGQKKKGIDIGAVAIAGLSERKDAMKEAFLTEEGVVNWRKHRIYDGAGLLAGVTLLLLWMNETGLLDSVMQWTETLPQAEQGGG